MSVEVVKKAGRLRLAAMTPNLPTAYEAVSFDPTPHEAGLYQALQFLPQRPDDPVIGDRYYRERVQMQVFISGPAGQGTAAVGQRAEEVRKYFKKGSVLFTETDWYEYFLEPYQNVYILRTPSVNPIGVVQNRVLAVVLIDLVGEVFS
jgi:hypothetical protein